MSEGDAEVVGGSHGLEADLADMEATGDLVRSKGWNLGETALATHQYLVDPDLLGSAALAPGTFARFQTGLLGALDAPEGLGANAVRMVACGCFLQARAASYAATDQALAHLADVRQHAQGLLLGLGLVAAPGTTAALTALALWRGDFFDDPDRWLAGHPEVVEELVASTPGMLDFFMPGVGFPADVAQGAALLALLYDQQLGGLTSAQAPDEAPASLAEAMRRLDRVAEQPDGFQIERIGTPPDEVYAVYLPGTKAFDGPFAPGTPGLPDALTESGQVQNLGTNVAGVAGVDNAYVEAVLRALDEVDVPPDAPVALIGHSQGGLVAARVAEAIAGTEGGRPYQVTDVVTAGSPVDGIDLPEDIRVLSLVNEYDLVPRLDGERYADRPHHTTIVVAEQTGTVAGNHSLSDLYLPMAATLEASEDPAVQDALAPLAGFHAGGDSTAWTFQMSR